MTHILFYIWKVNRWPLRYRRAFLILFPVTFPIWWAYVCLLHIFVALVIIIVGIPFMFWMEVVRPLWFDEKRADADD